MGFQKKKKQFDTSLYCVDCSYLVFLAGRLVIWDVLVHLKHWCVPDLLSGFIENYFLILLCHCFSERFTFFLCIEVLRPYDPHLLSLTPWIGFQDFPVQVLLYSSFCLIWSSDVSLFLLVLWQDAISGVCVWVGFLLSRISCVNIETM